jgi:hypothetical protein
MGGQGISKLGMLRVLNPAEFERQIREAMLAADNSVPEAATVLGCSVRNLFRWLAEERFDDIHRPGPGRPRHRR